MFARWTKLCAAEVCRDRDNAWGWLLGAKIDWNESRLRLKEAGVRYEISSYLSVLEHQSPVLQACPFFFFVVTSVPGSAGFLQFAHSHAERR